jgi:hypothetical protein
VVRVRVPVEEKGGFLQFRAMLLGVLHHGTATCDAVASGLHEEK